MMEPRWLTLYKLGTKKQINRNKIQPLICKECTFQPKINKKSQRLTRNIKGSVFERLYKNHSRT